MLLDTDILSNINVVIVAVLHYVNITSTVIVNNLLCYMLSKGDETIFTFDVRLLCYAVITVTVSFL